MAATQQLRDGQAQALVLGIEERRFDRAFGKAVVADGFLNAGHHSGHGIRISSDEQGRKISINGLLHAFWRFRAISQTTNGRAFAKADAAIRAANAHQHQALALHDGHRQLVRANCGQIHAEGLDLFNHDRGRAGVCVIRHGVIETQAMGLWPPHTAMLWGLITTL